MDVPRSQRNILSTNESITERDFVLLLIQLYRESPALWKVKSNDYTNKTKRNEAIQKILNVLKKYKPDFNGDKLKKKINILRTNFNKECQKLYRKRQVGGSSDVIAEPTLWYFNDIIFIKDQMEIDGAEVCEQSLVDELTSSSPQLVSSPIPLLPPSPEFTEYSTIPNKVIKRSPTSSFEEDISPQICFKNSEYEANILAQGWAIKLCRLAPDQRLFAEKIINDTLFEAELGTLTRNGVSFINPMKGKGAMP